MKTPRPLLLIIILILHLGTHAQVQWYQNQDGNNQAPYGTVGTAMQSFNSSSFIACYLWNTNGDENTWKISKSHINGYEQRTFFVTGIYALLEFKVGGNGMIYVFEKSFTSEYTPQYRVLKLDGNLTVKAQRNIEIPNGFFISNVNAFELDESSNVYFAGDGQVPDGAGGYTPSSFVWKMDKNLNTHWRKMDNTETSYSRLHIDDHGKVLVVTDHYSFFPQVRVRKFSSTGQYQGMYSIDTDPARYTLYSQLDKNNNLYIYGGKTVGDTAQAVYLYKIKSTGQVHYQKTYFTSSGSQLNDLRFDNQGNLFSLVTQTNSQGAQLSRISRVNTGTGGFYWHKIIPFEQDSCNLMRLVISESSRFYAVGERKSCTFFSKAFAIRIKKSNGHLDGDYPAPDSVSFQRSHWLADGIMDKNDELIALGNTTDLDTMTYSSTYFRSFAVRYNDNNCGWSRKGSETVALREAAPEDEEELTAQTKLSAYPNPVRDQLMVSGINTEEYDQLSVFNLQGMLVKQQVASASTARIDITGLTNGMYLLVLKSTISAKEKSLKFVVNK
jgi:hypothetical protein